MSMRTALFTALLVTACHARASEPTPPPTKLESTGAAVQRETHRIVDTDHRRLIPLHVDDVFVLPTDWRFDWHAELEDKSAFAPFTEVDAGADAFRLTKGGIYRTMIYGDPKCLKTDAACGLSKRRWDVTFDVK